MWFGLKVSFRAIGLVVSGLGLKSFFSRSVYLCWEKKSSDSDGVSIKSIIHRGPKSTTVTAYVRYLAGFRRGEENLFYLSSMDSTNQHLRNIFV